MTQYILWIHVALGSLLVLFILAQDKGVGFGSAIGGAGGGSFHASRRGAAKVLHYLTIFAAIGFFATAMLTVVV